MTTQTLNTSDDIAKYLTEVLQGITTANGFQTDIGERVFRGRLKHDEDRVPYSTLIEGEDKVTSQGVQTEIVVDQDFIIGAYLPCDPDNPNDAAHKAIRDIKKAVFSSGLARRSGGPGSRGQTHGLVKELTYGGKDIGPRSDGKAIVYAVVYFTIKYPENLLAA